MRPRCVLVGPPGAGKTTVGQLVAQQLEVDFADTDTQVEQLAGKPVADIFVDDGEETFRELERKAVATALGSCTGVLALGGGAVLSEATRTLLHGHTVVYLSVALPDAAARVGLGASRPLLRVNPRSTLKYLLAQRAPLYQQVATATVETDARTPAEVAAEVAALLRKEPPKEGG